MNCALESERRLDMHLIKGLRVLYVEDDPDVRFVTCEMLCELFSSVDVAADGEQGLEKYKSTQYDLVITDIKMPKMNGIEMISKIKSINKNQKFVVISGYDESSQHLFFISHGVSNFILKPFDFQKLVEGLSPVCQDICNAKSINQLHKELFSKMNPLNESNTLIDEKGSSLKAFIKGQYLPMYSLS